MRSPMPRGVAGAVRRSLKGILGRRLRLGAGAEASLNTRPADRLRTTFITSVWLVVPLLAARCSGWSLRAGEGRGWHWAHPQGRPDAPSCGLAYGVRRWLLVFGVGLERGAEAIRPSLIQGRSRIASSAR
jgi:hypothetical protein